MSMPVQRVVLIGGTTGAGKSTIADALARRLCCSVASFDWLVSALRSFPDVWDAVERPRVKQRQVGCALISRVVEQELRRGASVVIDVVAREEARAEWAQLAATYEASFDVIECVCSDLSIHRERVESRERAIPGWYELSWGDAERGRAAYTPLREPKLVIDAVDPLDGNLEKVVAYVGATASD